MPKPATKKTAAKVNSIEALKAKAEESARLAEAAEDSLRDAQHREMKRQTPEQVKKNKEQEEFYQKHKKEIDKELEECTSHLRKYDWRSFDDCTTTTSIGTVGNKGCRAVRHRPEPRTTA